MEQVEDSFEKVRPTVENMIANLTRISAPPNAEIWVEWRIKPSADGEPPALSQMYLHMIMEEVLPIAEGIMTDLLSTSERAAEIGVECRIKLCADEEPSLEIVATNSKKQTFRPG
jgi:hypothetical protein